jgi:hypothetical protein
MARVELLGSAVCSPPRSQATSANSQRAMNSRLPLGMGRSIFQSAGASSGPPIDAGQSELAFPPQLDYPLPHVFCMGHYQPHLAANIAWLRRRQSLFNAPGVRILCKVELAGFSLV